MRYDELAPEEQAWVRDNERIWARAHAIAARHPGMDPSLVYHERRTLAHQWADDPAHDESVDVDELREIVRQAAQARNGWKTILQRCAPVRRKAAASRNSAAAACERSA